MTAFAVDLTPRLVRPAPPARARTAPAAAPQLDRWLGNLHPLLVQRPCAPEAVLAVGRLRRMPGRRSLLIHVVEIAPNVVEIRHRLHEPDGPHVVLGTLHEGAGWLALPTRAGAAVRLRVEMVERKRHAGWNVFRAEASQ